MNNEEIPKCFYEMDVIPSEYFNKNYKTEDITKFIDECPEKFIQIMKDIHNPIDDEEYKYYYVSDFDGNKYFIKTNNYKNIVFDVFYLRCQKYKNCSMYQRIKTNIKNYHHSIANLNNFTAITYYIAYKYLHSNSHNIKSIEEFHIIDSIKSSNDKKMIKDMVSYTSSDDKKENWENL